MNFKAIFLIGILAFSFLAIGFDNVNGVILHITSQGSTQDKVGFGIINLVNQKGKTFRIIDIFPGQSRNIEITKDISLIKFQSVGAFKGHPVYINCNGLYDTSLGEDDEKISVWFHTIESGYWNVIGPATGVEYFFPPDQKWYHVNRAAGTIEWDKIYGRWIEILI